MTSYAFTRYIMPVLLLLLLGAFGCDGGGGDDNTPNPDGERPTITSLSRASANIGDELTINGLNFGDSQAGGSARLNGIDFVVNTWSDTQITTTVAAGMTSGIVVVIKDGLQSLSGAEAQLFIPSAPLGDPILSLLNPDYGRVGTDQIQILGFNFGSTQGTSRVMFTAGAAGVSQADNFVDAAVVTIDVGGTPVPQWTNGSIKVWVPATAVDGPVYVEVNGVRSNGLAFDAQPSPDTGPVDITAIDPLNGPVGTPVTITGSGFGHTQGGSTLTIGTPPVSLTVATWSDSEILATIAAGSQTGAIRVTKGASFDDSEIFVVANKPVITGVSPGEIRIGQPLTVYGQYFGGSQGTGSLRVGSTTVTVASENWSDGELYVPVLPTINYSDPLLIPVIVTADNSLASEPFNVSIVSLLSAQVGVTPSAGQRSSVDGTPGTTFAFNVSVFNGTGPFEYTLIPDADLPAETAPVSSSPTIFYTYPYSASAQDEENIQTRVRVRDTSNGDQIEVNGPIIKVVNFGVPVVTAIELGSYNRASDAPNDWVYTQVAGDLSYDDFVFLGDEIYFTSSKTEIIDQGNPVPSAVRNFQTFMSGDSAPRPYGHRYRGSTGSEVVVKGLNFGAAEGAAWLNSSDATNQVQVPGFNSWSDTEVRFDLPQEPAKSLSGTVRIEPSGAAKVATSVDKLICSAYISDIQPQPVDYNEGTLILQGFDLQPPQVQDLTGPSNYLFWVVRAQYDDPFGGGTASGLALVTTPFPVTPAGTQIQFDMSQIGAQPFIEVFDVTGTLGQIVQATSLTFDTTWYCFLWTGAIDAGSDVVRASSGVFSEAYAISVDDGGGGPGDLPTADLQANPTSGDSPLDVDFDASASSDPDGPIAKFEFDPEGDGSYVDNGTNPSFQHTYPADGVFNARLRVTDSDSNTDTASVTINVGGGGNMFSVSGTVNVLNADWTDPFSPPPAEPEAGIVITVYTLDGATEIAQSAPTDGAGNYTVPNIPENPDGIRVTVDPQGGYTFTILPATGYHTPFPFDSNVSGLNFLDSGGFHYPGEP